MRRTEKDVLEIPKLVWEAAETKEELEDWLLAQNRKLIRQLRRIRRGEDRAGKGKPISEIARRQRLIPHASSL